MMELSRRIVMVARGRCGRRSCQNSGRVIIIIAVVIVNIVAAVVVVVVVVIVVVIVVIGIIAARD